MGVETAITRFARLCAHQLAQRVRQVCHDASVCSVITIGTPFPRVAIAAATALAKMCACTRSNDLSLRSFLIPPAYAKLTRRLTSRLVSGQTGIPSTSSGSESPPDTEQATSTP